MKTVLIYGDSNTYGQTNWPFKGKPRLEYEERWTSRVQHHFLDKFRIIPEGLGGRTAGDVQQGDDLFRNGQTHFKTIFNSHQPVDILIVALGTNDCQTRYGRSAEQIYNDLLRYSVVAKKECLVEYEMPKVIYIVPPLFSVAASDVYFGGRHIVHDELVELMSQAHGMNVIRVDTVDTSDDGVHFSPEGHRQMAIAVEEKLKEIL